MNIPHGRRQWCLIPIMLSATLLSSPSIMAQDVTGQINLISTIGGNPSLSPLVTWKVFKVNPRDKKIPLNPPLYTLNRHSISLSLTPGHYKVVVSLADVVKEQDFKIQAEDKHTLEIAVDSTK